MVASFCVEAAAQDLWMSRLSARGWEMAVIPWWCHSRNGERSREQDETSHSFISHSFPLSLLCPPHLSCDGLMLQASDLYPRLSAAIFPSPALPQPAMLDPAPRTLDPVTEIPISCSCSSTQRAMLIYLMGISMCGFFSASHIPEGTVVIPSSLSIIQNWTNRGAVNRYPITVHREWRDVLLH